MRIVLLDLEANGFLPTVSKLWCVCTEDTTTGEQRDFIFPKDDYAFYQYCETVDRWVIHNGSGYDGPTITHLRPAWAKFFTNDKIIDTLIISRTTNYKRMLNHSLKNWGLMLGTYKGDFTDFSRYTPEMLKYCRQDVDVLKGVWSKLKKYCVGKAGTEWKEAFDLEKDTNRLLMQTKINGFKFNSGQAQDWLDIIQMEMVTLEAEFQKAWPPKLVLKNTLMYRTKPDGTEYKTVTNARLNYAKVVREGGMLECYGYEPFAPSSPRQRIDKLWDAGWVPYDKTLGHFKFLKSRDTTLEKHEKFTRYGWKCNEDNLKTLPDTAPEAAHKLATWLTLEGRRSSLVEWLGKVGDDGRIHGTVFHIGAWTHRCSHSGPNTANISRPWDDRNKPKTAVEVVKSLYDAKLRECWTVEDGNYLVGTDAEGIQLRILAHYMQSDTYSHAIVSGVAKLKTDIHNLNKNSLGSICRSRDDAKTFIYAWLLGAGVMKVASILGCTVAQAKMAVDSFLASLPELKRVKDIIVPRDAARGYFIGLDGRRVVQPDAYLMLAGYLQNGEAIIMKRAMRVWHKEAEKKLIKFKMVGFIHDEWQTECMGDKGMAEELGHIQKQSLVTVGEDLNLYLPLAGSTKIGTNWRGTH
ncbi:MAG: hypothetical protein JKY50_00240 [Oleispira sp.]|nr:hypothetical protein [Oleispira sp.]